MEELFRDFARARDINSENLRQILRDNQDTAYGKQYGFASMVSEKDFSDKVPLTDYSAYETLASDSSAFTVYPVRDVLLTSGTTGVQKEFPLTEEALSRYGSCICELPYTLMGGKEGPHLHTSVFRPAVKGRTLLSSAYYGYLKEEGALSCEAYLGGEEQLFSDGIKDVPYVKACQALCCPGLISIQSIFLYDILLLLRYLEEHWRELLMELEKSGALDRERGKELESVFWEGFETPIVPRIWKKLRFISGIGGPAYEHQEKALRRYTGEIPIYYFAYASSECMAGAALSMNRACYALLPRSAYYEFLTEEGVLVPEENLQIGASYELILTTFSGLYRYCTGDRIRIVDFQGEAPIFEVLGRDHLINIAGEKLHEEIVRKAVCGLADWLLEKYEAVICDFSLGIDTKSVPNRYWLFVELLGGPKELETAEAEEYFEKMLCSLSPDYEDVRGLGMILPPRICLLRQGMLAWAFSDTGKSPAHRKPHLFLSPVRTEVLLHRGMTDGEQ